MLEYSIKTYTVIDSDSFQEAVKKLYQYDITNQINHQHTQGHEQTFEVVRQEFQWDEDMISYDMTSYELIKALLSDMCYQDLLPEQDVLMNFY